jgi:hypothetical protein
MGTNAPGHSPDNNNDSNDGNWTAMYFVIASMPLLFAAIAFRVRWQDWKRDKEASRASGDIELGLVRRHGWRFPWRDAVARSENLNPEPELAESPLRRFEPTPEMPRLPLAAKTRCSRHGQSRGLRPSGGAAVPISRTAPAVRSVGTGVNKTTASPVSARVSDADASPWQTARVHGEVGPKSRPSVFPGNEKVGSQGNKVEEGQWENCQTREGKKSKETVVDRDSTGPYRSAAEKFGFNHGYGLRRDSVLSRECQDWSSEVATDLSTK